MLFAFGTILLLFFSCTKDKLTSIAGTWREVSVCSKDNSGNFYWSEAPRFPYILTLIDDGKYYGWNCVPAEKGTYQYDYANKKIRFEEIPSGNIKFTSVSFLDDKYLIFDYAINGIVEYRTKFIRSAY